ncbi:MAG: SDR family NAD(P)-dependent oxidoreductase [Cyclobacteriaceae bacterium]
MDQKSDIFKGKVALVTGATRGIGKSIAMMLAKNGVHLLITGRAVDKLCEICDMAAKYGVKVHSLVADIKDPETPKILMDDLYQHFDRLDFLINNAGAGFAKSFENTTVEDWDYLMNVNAKAPFFVCKEAIPLLKKSDSATIVNISSVVGRLGYELQSAYSASKHALMGYTKVLAKELKPHNIRVHAIAPGGVATEMIDRMRPDIDPEELIKPEDVAKVVEFLLTFRGSAMIDEINLRRYTGIPWQ